MRNFNRLCLNTLIAVYILILVGGVVRSTGSGMGCPDWPRCFGNWVPPTSIQQLPPDYKEKYAEVRAKKNLKFARYLKTLGMDSTADQLLNDKTVLVEGDFNPVKSWIEYINRLIGVVIGFFIIAVAYRSLPFRKTDPVIFIVGVTTLLAVIFQGWFGSIVVSTNLTTWTVTVHMFIALQIVAMLVFLYIRTAPGIIQPRFETSLVLLTVTSIVVLLLQVFFGTEVRSGIDVLAAAFPRSEWLERLGGKFVLHRSFSWAVLLVSLALAYLIRKTPGLGALSRYLLVLILGTFLSGAGMAYLSVPAMLQPLHLLIATLTVGVEVYILFRLLPFTQGRAQQV